MSEKRDELRKAAIAKFEASEGLNPNGNDVIARADRMSMIAFGRGFDAGHAALAAARSEWVDVADRQPDSDGWYWAMVDFKSIVGDEGGPLVAEKRRYAIEVDGTGYWISSAGPVVAWMPIPPYQRPSREGE